MGRFQELILKIRAQEKSQFFFYIIMNIIEPKNSLQSRGSLNIGYAHSWGKIG